MHETQLMITRWMNKFFYSFKIQKIVFELH